MEIKVTRFHCTKIDTLNFSIYVLVVVVVCIQKGNFCKIKNRQSDKIGVSKNQDFSVAVLLKEKVDQCHGKGT